jgi:xylulokinase
MSLLGIDVGTTGCKAGVFAQDGQLLASAYEEYDVRHPRLGWAELDGVEVWAQVRRTIRNVVSHSAADPVQALAVSSMGEAMVPVTRDRRILGPSILNFDVRGEEYLQGLGRALADEWLYHINGNRLGNHYSLTKLKWIKEHQPDLYERTDKFLLWAAFVSFMLGAEPVVDYSLANRTLLLDINQATWSDELLEVAGLDKDKLPETAPAGQVVGAVSGAAADELGLPVGVPIVTGGHDQCVNGVGCGVIEAGRAMFGMGTFLCAMPVFSRRHDPAAMLELGLNTEHHAVPGQYVSFIYNQGGAQLKWFRDTFAAVEHQQAKERDLDVYANLIAEMPERPSSIMSLPHWSTTGPPAFISNSSGMLAGLKLETARGDILKGMLEAIAFDLQVCIERLPEVGIEIGDYRVVGGGSKSDMWIQLCVDILGRPFVRPKITEAGILGAAILAGAGAGIVPSLEAGVETMVKLERTFEPDTRKHKFYEGRFEKYKQLWPLLKDYLRGLSQSNNGV